MNATALAVTLSLASALAYASAAVAQERIVARARPGAPLRSLLGTGVWWASTGLNLAGSLLHVVALRHGPLTVVQPLGALTLVVAVPLGALVARRRVGEAEWRGTALTLLGLAALLLTVSGPVHGRALSPASALAVAGGAVVLLAALCRPADASGLCRAAASGVASGVASALTQTMTVTLTRHDGPAAVAWGQTVLMGGLVAGFAVGGLLLAQSAYRGGLGAPLATSTLANPLTAALIGVWLLGEGVRGGVPGLLLAAAGGLTAARGVLLLTRAAARPERRGRRHGPSAAAPSPDRGLSPRDGLPLRGQQPEQHLVDELAQYPGRGAQHALPDETVALRGAQHRVVVRQGLDLQPPQAAYHEAVVAQDPDHVGAVALAARGGEQPQTQVRGPVVVVDAPHPGPADEGAVVEPDHGEGNTILGLVVRH